MNLTESPTAVDYATVESGRQTDLMDTPAPVPRHEAAVVSLPREPSQAARIFLEYQRRRAAQGRPVTEVRANNTPHT